MSRRKGEGIMRSNSDRIRHGKDENSSVPLIPVALSASRAMPQACIPPIWFCTRLRFLSVTCALLWSKLSIQIPLVNAYLTWKVCKLLQNLLTKIAKHLLFLSTGNFVDERGSRLILQEFEQITTEKTRH